MAASADGSNEHIGNMEILLKQGETVNGSWPVYVCILNCLISIKCKIVSLSIVFHLRIYDLMLVVRVEKCKILATR